MGSGGFRTWGDVIKGVALGLDGVILGTADLVAIGCVRDRNCESGCRSGISTIEPKMQLLRNVEINAQQIINFRAILQAQTARAIAALGMKDIRELRGRYDCIEWSLMEERVQERRRRRTEISRRPAFEETDGQASLGLRRGCHCLQPFHSESCHGSDAGPDGKPWDGWRRNLEGRLLSPSHGSLCPPRTGQRGAAITGGAGVSRETSGDRLYRDPTKAREEILAERRRIMQEILLPYFTGLRVEDFDGDLEKCRIPYRRDQNGEEQDFRLFGEKDPGDVFRFFVRVRPEELYRFIENDLLKDPVWPPRQIRYRDLTVENYKNDIEFLHEAEDEYIYRLARIITRENYAEVQQKKAAVLSCGKNSGCWKSDGKHIPWELPDAPVNVIHRRLATGSVVDQMNAHPFAELHTALTHNGETTNYRTMWNRVSQFNLTPLAQTDTAVASLKLHLLSQYLHYPFDALVESFSPTTGWNLTQLSPAVREHFQRVQEVELESAPDGPYQYLCGRIDPYRRVIERLDIIDPSLLRPNVAMLYDDGENFVSIICSEKQGSDAGIQELYRLGLMRSTSPALTFTVNTGMVSRVFYDEKGRITGHEVVDKFGHPVKIPHGEFPSVDTVEPIPSVTAQGMDIDFGSDAPGFIKERLPLWRFNEFGKALEDIRRNLPFLKAVEQLTRIYDTLPGWDIGSKDRGTLIHMVHEKINSVLDRRPRWQWKGPGDD